MKVVFNILFVGNSFIYTGDVPKQLSNIAKMYGITITYDTIAPAGSTLNNTMDRAIEKIRNNSYDYVVLQDYGGRQMDDLSGFNSDIQKLCEEIYKANALAVLYNPAWCNINSERPDKTAQVELTIPYEIAAETYGAILVNAADAWVYAYDKHPELSLYYMNDYHPNDEGAYLTACVFASTLFELHVKDISEQNIYHGDDAILLGQAAWEFVTYYNEHHELPVGIITVPDGLNVCIS